jgi:phenol 2-monooxygenase (NADPH)
MQFHLNGFRPGDPGISDPAEGYDTPQPSDGLPDEVDVLIVGSGPTGLTLAAQLAAFPEIRTRIIEQKPGRLLRGQADGIAVRTVEVFEAFGFSERVLKEAYWVNETTFWRPDEERPGVIVRSSRIQDTEDGLSEFPHVILNQARVHDFLLDVMANAPTRLAPDYSRRLAELEIDRGVSDGGAGASHPVTVRVERVDPGHQGQIEAVRARYVVGCDGAHSTVRSSIGRVLRGDSANQAWGVMDVLAVTDFPDVRLKTLIQSAADGSLLIIPREGGYLARLYIELDQLDAGERVADRNITVDEVIEAARRVLHPYRLDVKEVAWWSVYEIGQRLCDTFDDVSEADVGSRLPRVFIAGDACHTHSPKAGQGMNVSIRDAFNLGWKLASVLLGRCSPAILNTYTAERRAVAKELIDFDRVWARMMSLPPKSDSDPDGVDPVEFQRYFVRQLRYTAGTTIQYGPSILSARPTYQHLAEGLPIGMRFHSAPVLRLADAKPVQLGHVVKADGRWRLFVFAGAEDPATPSSSVAVLCDFLSDAPDSPIRSYTPADTDVDSVIDVRAVFQQDHRLIAIEAMPPFLLPRKGRYGLVDYEKMFCADPTAGRDIFDMRGIDRDRGCMVVVRPDQHVAHVLPLDGHAELAAFFAAFMVDAAGESAAVADLAAPLGLGD